MIKCIILLGLVVLVMKISIDWILNKAKQKIYAVTHAKAVIRGNSTVDQDLTKIEGNIADMGKFLHDREDLLNKIIMIKQIAIPISGWTPYKENVLKCEMGLEKITDEMMAIVVIDPDKLEVAKNCGFKNYCKTENGKLVFFSQREPTVELEATLALFG